MLAYEVVVDDVDEDNVDDEQIIGLEDTLTPPEQ